MKRRNFLKAIGIGTTMAVVAPRILTGELEGKELPKGITIMENPKGLAIDADKYIAGTDPYGPEQIIEIYNRTGNIVYPVDPEEERKRREFWADKMKEVEYNVLFNNKKT